MNQTHSPIAGLLPTTQNIILQPADTRQSFSHAVHTQWFIRQSFSHAVHTQWFIRQSFSHAVHTHSGSSGSHSLMLFTHSGSSGSHSLMLFTHSGSSGSHSLMLFTHSGSSGSHSLMLFTHSGSSGSHSLMLFTHTVVHQAVILSCSSHTGGFSRTLGRQRWGVPFLGPRNSSEGMLLMPVTSSAVSAMSAGYTPSLVSLSIDFRTMTLKRSLSPSRVGWTPCCRWKKNYIRSKGLK